MKHLDDQIAELEVISAEFVQKEVDAKTKMDWTIAAAKEEYKLTIISIKEESKKYNVIIKKLKDTKAAIESVYAKTE